MRTVSVQVDNLAPLGSKAADAKGKYTFFKPVVL